MRLNKNIQLSSYPKNIMLAECGTYMALRIHEYIKTWGESFNKTLEESDLFFGYLTMFFQMCRFIHNPVE
jgi:hypothetical protein